MAIGLDLSVLQSPHRMRGIGSTAINFVNNIPSYIKSENSFILYLYEDGMDEALALLKLDGLKYETRKLYAQDKATVRLPSRLHVVNSAINHIFRTLDRRRGDTRIQDTSGLSSFLQFDPMQPLPKSRNFKRGLIIYDLIPYVMESDYLWSYKTARSNRCSRRSALRRALLRRQYIQHVRAISNEADELFAISKHTKDDYVKYARISPDKIKVTYLGINNAKSEKAYRDVSFEKYVDCGWGYVTKDVDLKAKKFLLFIGGADPRRRLKDLVAAYNNLKAQGYDISLVLAGDIMKGPNAIPVPNVQEYLSESSFLEDIVFLGFVDNEQRDWLYTHTIALVYPSVYEGFGLPVLEAMQHGTPVITYKNSSIYEIAADAAMYAKDSESIRSAAETLISNQEVRTKYSKLGLGQAKKFTWLDTTKNIFGSLLS